MFSAREACKGMAKPTRRAHKRLKRMGRYLVNRPRVRQKFVHQALPAEMYAYVDSDWAGCRTTRKSTSGGVLMLGRHPLRAWSSTQGVVALSSGEAEYFAALKRGAVMDWV